MGQINFLWQFIAERAWKVFMFVTLLRIQMQEDFIWKVDNQTASEEIEEYLTKPPVLVPP